MAARSLAYTIVQLVSLVLQMGLYVSFVFRSSLCILIEQYYK